MTTVQKNEPATNLPNATIAELEYWLFPQSNEQSVTPQTLNSNTEYNKHTNSNSTTAITTATATANNNSDNNYMNIDGENTRLVDNSLFNQNILSYSTENKKSISGTSLGALNYNYVDPKAPSFLDPYNLNPTFPLSSETNMTRNSGNSNLTLTSPTQSTPIVPDFFSLGLEALPNFYSETANVLANIETENDTENDTLKDDATLDDPQSIDSNWNRQHSIFTSEISFSDSKHNMNKAVSPLHTPTLPPTFYPQKDIDYFSLSNSHSSSNNDLASSIGHIHEDISKLNSNNINCNSPYLVSPRLNKRNSKTSRRSSIRSLPTNSDDDCSKYPCNFCGKIFKRPSSLGTHMNIHTGFKPYVCPFQKCHKSFNAKSNMLRHYKLHFKLPSGAYKLPDGKVSLVAPTTKQLFDANDVPKPIIADAD